MTTNRGAGKSARNPKSKKQNQASQGKQGRGTGLQNGEGSPWGTDTGGQAFRSADQQHQASQQQKVLNPEYTTIPSDAFIHDDARESAQDGFLPFHFSRRTASKLFLSSFSKKCPLNAPVLFHVHDRSFLRRHIFSMVSMLAVDFDLAESELILPHSQVGTMHGVMTFVAKPLDRTEARQMIDIIYWLEDERIESVTDKYACKFHVQYDSKLRSAPILSLGSRLSMEVALVPKESSLIQTWDAESSHVGKQPVSRSIHSTSSEISNAHPQNDTDVDSEEFVVLPEKTQQQLEDMKESFRTKWHGNILIRDGYYVPPREEQVVDGYTVLFRVLGWEDELYSQCKYARYWFGRVHFEWKTRVLRDSPRNDIVEGSLGSTAELQSGDVSNLPNPFDKPFQFVPITSTSVDDAAKVTLQEDSEYTSNQRSAEADESPTGCSLESLPQLSETLELGPSITEEGSSIPISTTHAINSEGTLNPMKTLKKVQDIFVRTQSTIEIESRLRNHARGIIVHGSSGVGKSFSCKKIAKDLGFNVMYISLSSIPHDTIGFTLSEMTKRLKKPQKKRQVVILDDMQVLKDFPAAVFMLTVAMDDFGQDLETSNVSFVGIVQKISQVPDILRRHGRFDHEVHFTSATIEERKNILLQYYNVSRHVPANGEEIGHFETIAAKSIGFVVSDIISLHREACFLYQRDESLNKSFSPEYYLKVIDSGIVKATLQKEEENVINVIDEVKDMGWSDIGGLEEVKKKLRQCAEWPLKYKDEFQKLGLTAPRGILMYGPPGCGKTSLVKALARSTKSAFLSLNSAAVYSPYFGDAEKTIREVFKKARHAAPSIIFFDEIDAMVGNRAKSSGSSGVEQRILSTILNEMDGIEYTRDVLVVAATNRPDMIDAALMRPGRLDYVVYIPPPDYLGRLDTFRVHCKHLPLGDDVSIEELAHSTEGFTGADIESLCREAAMHALRQNIESHRVSLEHFQEAKRALHPSITPQMIADYETFESEFTRSK